MSEHRRDVDVSARRERKNDRREGYPRCDGFEGGRTDDGEADKENVSGGVMRRSSGIILPGGVNQMHVHHLLPVVVFLQYHPF